MLDERYYSKQKEIIIFYLQQLRWLEIEDCQNDVPFPHNYQLLSRALSTI